MKGKFSKLVFAVVLVCIAGLATPSIAEKEEGRKAPKSRSKEKPLSLSEYVGKDESGRGTITFNFDNVDVRLVIKLVSDITGKNFIVHDAVRGPVTVISPKKIPVSDSLKALGTILELRGYAMVPDGDFIKIIPKQQAVQGHSDFRTAEEASERAPEYTVVTKIVPLQYANPKDLQYTLQSLAGKYSKILCLQSARALIITDTASSVERLEKIAMALDKKGNGGDLRTLIGTVSEKTGKSFVLGKEVRGTITLLTRTELPEGKELESLKTILDVYGFKMEPEGELIKVVLDPSKRMEEHPPEPRRPESAGEKSAEKEPRRRQRED